LVLSAILSLRGALFVAMFGILLLLGQVLWILETLAFVLLFVGAVRLAWRAMAMVNDELEFPEVAIDDTVVNVFIFSLLFIGLPLGLISLSLQPGVIPPGVGVPIALALLAYAPIALVLMLKRNAISGVLDVGTALKAVRHDPGGYLFLTVLVLGSFGLTLLLSSVWQASRFPAAVVAYIIVVPLLGLTVPLAFGLCGLYVRSKARLLQVACDEEDWTRAVPVSAPDEPPPAPQPPATPISLPPVAPPAADAIPVVAGQLLSAPDEPPLVQGVLEPAPPTAQQSATAPDSRSAGPTDAAPAAGAATRGGRGKERA
jgi:hypothetical protein